MDVSLLITNCSVFESEAAAAVPRNGDHYSSSHEYRSTNAFVSTYYVHGTCETFQTSDVDTAKIYPLQLSLDPPSSIIEKRAEKFKDSVVKPTYLHSLGI